MFDYENALRTQLRFDTPQGLLTIEDVWQLPLKTAKANKIDLDQLALVLYQKVKSAGDIVSFVDSSKADTADQMRFDLVKHVIDVKLKERKDAEEAQERKQQRQKILAIIADKEDEGLKGASLDELKAKLKEL